MFSFERRDVCKEFGGIARAAFFLAKTASPRLSMFQSIMIPANKLRPATR